MKLYSNKDLAAMSSDELVCVIDEAKENVKDKYEILKRSKEVLNSSYNDYMEALSLAEENPKKYSHRLSVAKDEYEISLSEHIAITRKYDNAVEAVLDLYNALAGREGRAASKAEKNAARFAEDQATLKENISFSVADAIEGIDLSDEKYSKENYDGEEKKEEKKDGRDADEDGEDRSDEEEKAPTHNEKNEKSEKSKKNSDISFPGYNYPPNPMMYSMPYPQFHNPNEVKVAPVNIDISEMIEEGVAIAMEKFKEILLKRTENIESFPSREERNEEKEGDECKRYGENAASVEELAAQIKSMSDKLQRFADELSEMSRVIKSLANESEEVSETSENDSEDIDDATSEISSSDEDLSADTAHTDGSDLDSEPCDNSEETDNSDEDDADGEPEEIDDANDLKNNDSEEIN